MANKTSQDGIILANGCMFDGHDFNEFGAFVQQDDCLLGTQTPRELFTFACRMRTDLVGEKLENRVNSLA